MFAAHCLRTKFAVRKLASSPGSNVTSQEVTIVISNLSNAVLSSAVKFIFTMQQIGNTFFQLSLRRYSYVAPYLPESTMSQIYYTRKNLRF
uniref:Secreted protein n=1 Tax=Strongyloides papillosus TaxID=174720 RepID=A0A0N5C3Q3_STREA